MLCSTNALNMLSFHFVCVIKDAVQSFLIFVFFQLFCVALKVYEILFKVCCWATQHKTFTLLVVRLFLIPEVHYIVYVKCFISFVFQTPSSNFYCQNFFLFSYTLYSFLVNTLFFCLLYDLHQRILSVQKLMANDLWTNLDILHNENLWLIDLNWRNWIIYSGLLPCSDNSSLYTSWPSQNLHWSPHIRRPKPSYQGVCQRDWRFLHNHWSNNRGWWIWWCLQG